MPIREDAWPNGTPCWADLVTTDRRGAYAFYRALLGWDFEILGPDKGDYALALADGLPAAGIGEPPLGSPPPPPAWTTYLATDDLDKTASVIEAHGGTLVLAPLDVGTDGRLGIAMDPTGAVFGMWQAGEHIGARVVNQPGSMCWNECLSDDAALAREFYSTVYGYRYGTVIEQRDYVMIARPQDVGPEVAIGGIGQLAHEVTPSHWMTYFAVADTDAAADTVLGNGGKVLVEPRASRYGPVAVCTDPQGAVFSIITVTPLP